MEGARCGECGCQVVLMPDAGWPGNVIGTFKKSVIPSQVLRSGSEDMLRSMLCEGIVLEPLVTLLLKLLRQACTVLQK